MANKYRLYYDANCPVCSNYVKILRKKVDINLVEFIPSPSDAKDFQFVDLQGKVTKGEAAIEQLALAFPEVKNFFWMLPDKFKLKALKTAYKVGNAVRKVITKSPTPKKTRRPCNCGK